MSKEENIQQDLVEKFAYLKAAVNIIRPRRISLGVEYRNFPEVFKYAAEDLKFNHLCTITGLDEQDKLSFIYHLAHESGVVLNIKISVPKENPVLKTVTALFPGADIYERELVDLLGAKVEGLPAGARYPLSDNWPAGQYPLRKDWKPQEAKDA